ncbi:hypothetical protein [Oceanirhabdus sp. W0125-5]|uniref:hypothetical protein n=1 Tax=Oceanirhabdus sp. W0125-5 TaxID=2999116 RepID=UPI0022F30E88|nr:hypothetical protein [Oceanirhabdus sp. W0125-5]WBW97167.1 hypothetical protein OW730_26285 [Oceanirhabdus sp. W0125-5]
MRKIRNILSITKADFLERIRQDSFLIIIMFMVYSAYLFVPDKNTKFYLTLKLTQGETSYRGIYNSPWLGSLSALVSVTIMTFIGFYIVKNAIERDRDTGVGQIIAASSVGKIDYLVGKTLSNFIYLTVAVVVIAITTLGMQVMRAESLNIEIWKLFAPFLIVVLPAMFLISAIAIFFEVTPFLSKGIGNFIYFGLYMFLIINGISSNPQNINGTKMAFKSENFYDISGFTILSDRLKMATMDVFPQYTGKNFSVGFEAQLTNIKTFVWSGEGWSKEILLSRLFWIGVAIVIVLIATLIFRRSNLIYKEKVKTKVKIKSNIKTFKEQKNKIKDDVVLTPYKERKMKFNTIYMLYYEFILIFKGLSKWWYLVAGGLIVAGLSSPIDVVKLYILPITWIWPVFIWSKIGISEKRYGTEQYIYSCNNFNIRQFIILWISGVILSLLTACGVCINLLINGELLGFFAVMVGAAFISALALVLGIWTGKPKVFEIVYMILWYIGPINSIPEFDYMGVTSMSIEKGITFIFLILTIVFLVFGYIGRIKRIKSI